MHVPGRRSALLMGLLFFSLVEGRLVAQVGSPPQPEIDAEFRAAVRVAAPLAERIAGDSQAFRVRVQPFGPLDLLVLRATSGRYASNLRGFFLGVMGGAARIDPGPLANAWHCGPVCASARRDTLVQHLPAIRSLVERFRAMKGVDVLAPWPSNGYRAGLLAFDGRSWRLDTPSPLMGFVPWQSEALTDSGRTRLATMGTDRAAVEAVINEMRALDLAVLARDSAGAIRAVLIGGIGDNEAGLLFVPVGAPAPSFEGLELLDGRAYVGGEAVASGVYFYVTT